MTFSRLPPAVVLAVALLPSGALGQTPTDSRRTNAEPLTLPDAIELALAHHPAIGEATARQEAAGGALRVAEASRLPLISSDASLSRYQEPSLVAPLHGFDPTMAPSFDKNLVRGNLTLSYAVYDGGAREARIAQAETGEAVAYAGQMASRMDVMSSVSATFLEILASMELLNAAESQRQALGSERDRVVQFLAEGKSARVDLLRVEAALSQAEATEISLEARLNVARGRLGRFTGLSAEEILARGLVSVPLRPRPAASLPEALAKAREASPELEVARQALAGATAGVRLAQSSWYPSVRAGGAYSDFGALDGGHTLEWQGSLQVSLPLFTGGARKWERERAAAEERRAAEGLRAAEMAVANRVEASVAAVEEARSLREALERGAERAEEVARIEGLALEVGSGVQAEFLRAQAGLFQARAALSQARYGEVMALVQLSRVTGELTQDWFQENMEVVR